MSINDTDDISFAKIINIKNESKNDDFGPLFANSSLFISQSMNFIVFEIELKGDQKN